jgi:hypothetical protein
MNTTTLPGWLQVVLVWLCGVVGWLLLRPYRRITQLGGRDPAAAIASAGSWHRRFFRDVRETAPAAVARPGGGSEAIVADRPPTRIELRAEAPLQVKQTGEPPPERPPATIPRRRMPAPSGGGWSEPAPDSRTAYALYRPRRSEVTTTAPDEDLGRTAARAEARRDS